ncbi:MAG: type II and III secretion system protein [candidate division KSB1 bacterium]|nr:type II and III secretion system protein [candidate division KSB1 bacterium]
MLGLFFISTFESRAQENAPVRSYRGEEFVSLNDAVPFNTAIEILNQFSTKYEGKIIVDPKRRQHKIGVVIDNMYWKKAFEYILSSNGLRYQTYDRYYEILGEEEEPAKPGKEEEVKLNTATKEVRIEATFFEADRKTLSQIGIDWTTLKNGTVRIDAKASSNLAQDALSAMYKLSTDVWDVLALMRTIENLSKGEVIAQPQIKVMEGVEGKVKVGKNFYLTTRDFAGNTQYREYEAGVILTVTPRVITIKDTTFIHLDLKAERSQVIPDPTGVSKAIIESRTQVLLLNGEQTAIGGLYSDEKSISRIGIPVLKDLPWWFFGLRYLFGFNSSQIEKKELIILIKAEIVPGIASRKVNDVRQKKYFDSLKERMFK